ncbi:MAG: hypothetical protein IKA70_07955 [Alistipes sp.]|nr:hypothetical protein [Alistipes sp.]
MKARKFFAFVAGAAMLFGAVGCTTDDAEKANDTEKCVITVAPESVATTLEGGDCAVTVTTNGSWTASCDVEGVAVTPAEGTGNAEVVITVPETDKARNFSVVFNAEKMVTVEGYSSLSHDDATVTVYQNASGDDSVETNVAEVRALLEALNPTKNGVEVTAEIAAMTLTGVVIAEPDSNMGNNKTIAIQDDDNAANGGLTIYCTDNVSDDLEIGNIVNINLTGAKAALYGGQLQVSNIASTAIVADGSANVTAIDVTLDNILDYESQYVKLSGVSPVQSFVGQAWNDTGSTRNVTFTTEDGKTFDVRVSAYASFKDEIIPGKTGSLCGCAGVYNGAVQLWPQTSSDIQLTNDIVSLTADDIVGVSADGVADATAEINAMNISGAITATPDGVVVTKAEVSGSTLTYTVSANTTADTREGSIVLSAAGVEDVTIKVSQLAAGKTTIDIKDVIADAEVTIRGLVSAVGSKAAVLTDATGSILLYYNKVPAVALGDDVEVKGTAIRYKGFPTNSLQIDMTTVAEGDVVVHSSGNTVSYNPTVLDGAAIDGMVGKDADCIEVQFEGTLNIGQYANVTIEGGNKQASLYYVDTNNYAAYNGAKVVVKGYVTGTYNYLNVLPYSVTSEAKVIMCDDIVVPADGATDEVANFTALNITGAITATPDGVVVTKAEVSGSTVIYSVGANTGEAREGSITLSGDGVVVVVKVSQAKKPAEGAGSYELTLADITSITYSDSWCDWTKTAADGSLWSGFAYKQTKYYQFSWSDKDGKNAPSADQNKAYMLLPAVPAGKTITKITITPYVEGNTTTTNGRKFVVLPADFAYTTTIDSAATEAVNAAYAISAATVKNSTDPIVIDLSGVANLPQQVQVRAILGAAYISSIKVEFE